jgi:hypothetical protein
MSAEVDPRLLHELEEAGDDGEVEAAVTIERADGQHAERLLDRVAERVQQQPQDVEIMPNLGTVIVKGTGRFVRELVAEDEVTAASSMEGEVEAL